MVNLQHIERLAQVVSLLSHAPSSPEGHDAMAEAAKLLSSLITNRGKEGCCHEPHRLFVQDKLVQIGADDIVEPVEEEHEGDFQDDALREFIRTGAGQTYEIAIDNRDELVIKWKTQDD